MVDASVACGEVNGIEMHGTGTALGDPIEIGALMAVFEGLSLLLITCRSCNFLNPTMQGHKQFKGAEH